MVARSVYSNVCVASGCNAVMYKISWRPVLSNFEIAPELKHRMLPDRVMRGKEGSEFQARHGVLSGCHFLFVER